MMEYHVVAPNPASLAKSGMPVHVPLLQCEKCGFHTHVIPQISLRCWCSGDSWLVYYTEQELAPEGVGPYRVIIPLGNQV